MDMGAVPIPVCNPEVVFKPPTRDPRKFLDASASLVVRLWGEDVPGISSAFIDLAVGHNVEVLDMSQFLLGSTLMYTIVLGTGSEDKSTVHLMKEFTRVAQEKSLHIEFHARGYNIEGSEALEAADNVAVLSLVSASPITPNLLHDVDVALSGHGVAVLSIEHRSDNKKEANGEYNKLKFLLRCPADLNLGTLVIAPSGGESLQEAAWKHGAEVSARWYNALGRPIGKSLVVFGLSHVLYPNDVMNEVLREAELDPNVIPATGSIAAQCKAKAQLLQGKRTGVVQQVIDRLQFTPGAFEVCTAFKQMGFRLAVLTNTGLREVAQHVKRQLGIDYVICRDMAVDEETDTFTGDYVDEVSDVSFRKVDLLRLMAERDGIGYRNVIVIGEFLKGLKATSAQSFLGAFGPNVFFNSDKLKDLTIVLYLLGLDGADVRDLCRGRTRASPKTIEDEGAKKHVVVQVSSQSREPGQISRVLAPLCKIQTDMHVVTIRQCSSFHGGSCLGFDLLSSADHETITKEILFACHKNKLQLHEAGERSSTSSRPCWLHPGHKRHVITLVQKPRIAGSSLQAVLGCVTDKGANIVKMERLSIKQLAAMQFTVDFPGDFATDAFSDELVSISRKHGADVSFQKDDLQRMMRRVVIFDMDSTLIEGEVIDELAKICGVEEQVSKITAAAMRGEINFFDSLKQRVALLKGHNAEELFSKVKSNLKYSPGAEKLCSTLKSLGYKMAVISGGFLPMAKEVQRHLGLDYAFANSLEVDSAGLLTGVTTGPVVTPQRKRALLGTIANVEGCEIRQTIAVGDGANDIPMLNTAGLGVAFCAKPRVQEVADFCINQKDLSTILYLIGVSEHAAEHLASDNSDAGSNKGSPRMHLTA